MPTTRLLAFAATLPFAAAGARAQNQPWLNAPVVLEQLPGSFRLLGDVDHDGDVDAIAFGSLQLNAILDNYTVMRNDGAGNFTGDPTVPLPAGVFDDMGIGDVDGDGWADLVLEADSTHVQGYGVLILPGLPGGSFGNPQHIALPGSVSGLAVGNGNGDARADVFVMHRIAFATYEQRWIFGAAGFAMTPAPASPALGGPRTLLDANGDGIDDIAYEYNPGGGSRNVIIEATTGSGFTTILTQFVPLAWLDEEIHAVDIDGDGDKDLIGTTGYSSTRITTLTNAGGGVWTLASNSFPGAWNGRLWPGDWDGDGDNDLVVRGYGQATAPFFCDITLYRNTGQGQFERRSIQRIAGQPFGWGAGTCDLDGDGDVDFVGSNILYFNDGTMDDPLGPTVAPPNFDWDDDGDVDGDIAGYGLNRNDGTGRFTPEPFVLPVMASGQQFGQLLVLTDFDGDGLHEMLIELNQFQNPTFTFLGTVLLRETADLQFAYAGFAAAPGVRITGKLVDDVDDDGDLDLIGTSGAWVNDGTNHFTLVGPGFGNYQIVAKADVNGDGKQDLLAIAPLGASAALMVRTGPATWSTTVLTSPSMAPNATNASFADVDDDGDMDVVGIEQWSSSPAQSVVFENQGGMLTLAAALPYGGKALVADFDGDGISDLALHHNFTRVLRRTGPGLTYATPVTFATPPVDRVVDVDQDGDDDLMGERVVRSTRFHGPTAGARRQYGRGGVGSGGRRPVLSMTGIVREGEAPAVRLRSAPGGAPAILLVASGADDSPSPVLPGVQSYVSGLFLLLGLNCAGPVGLAGRGALELPVSIPAGVGGSRLFFEFLVLDAAVPGFLGYSNGCEILVGH